MNETNVDLSALPEGWVRTTLGEIHLDLSQSINPRTMPDQLFELYSVPSFATGKPEITQGNNIGSSKRIIQNEAVLLCKINPRINRIWVVENHTDYPQIASTEWIPFFNLQGLEPRYLCYFLTQHCLRDFLASNVSGVGGSLMRIKPTTFANYPFPIAPLSEQHRIVVKIEELFTKLDAGKEELLQAKARLKRYRQSVLKAAMEGNLTEDWRREHGGEIEPASVLLDRVLKERREKWEAEQLEQMMAKGKMPKDDKWKNKYKEPPGPDTSKLPELPKGWVWGTLPQIGELNRGKSKHRPRNAAFLFGGRYPFVQTGDIKQANGLIGHYNQTYSEEGLKQSRLWPAGTLCITIAANIADTAILGFDACFPDSVVGFLSEKGQCNIRFVEFFLRTAKEDLERYAPATAQKNINLGTLKDLAIPFSPLSEQNVITEEIDRRLSVADAVETTVDAELKRSDALRQSILKQAFSGKLVPQDSNDEPAEKLLERIKKEKAKREVDQKANSKTKKQLALFEH